MGWCCVRRCWCVRTSSNDHSSCCARLTTCWQAAGHGWLLAAHDLIVAWNLASLGRLEDAELAARSSLERFDAEGEVLLVVSPLNALAGIAEARGDLDEASVAYEALLERCRATGQRLYVPFGLVALAGLRARQGDDALADRLYDEAIGCCFNPWLSADAMVGQAAVARRLGDLTRSRALLDGGRQSLPRGGSSRWPAPGARWLGMVGARRRPPRRRHRLRG